ncbi:MAG: S8 family serine peptidase [Clostridia bacterium]|nr:S8 family serine peptidase [Clostridia bacterium]
MKFKIILSVLLCAILILPAYSVGAYVPEPVFDVESPSPEEQIAPSEEVTFIVEIEGDPVLAGEKAAVLGTDYIYTEDGQNKEEAILEAQDEVIDKIGTQSQVEAVYTMLFNGFAIKGTYGELEKIKEIDGVKNVYISENIKLEPHLSTSVGITGVKDEPISGYTGKGQLVAIIDSEFDVDHEVFGTAPEGAKYPTQESVQTLLSGKTLSRSFAASKVFVSTKVPFAYDYGGNDYDLYATTNIHGTHVASIAAGNSTTAKGVAPDAQLVLMKMTTNSGVLDTISSFTALEDAVKLGVCAINCSFGADYISPNIEAIWETSYRNARNAGVMVCVSSGNMGRGYKKATPLTTDIDYGASGIPATTTAVMSVGNATKSSPNYGNMSTTSSYGVSENLDLKPEITAPGASIYAAKPDNKYEYKSGTSMAAPHMTGVVAVVNEYFDKNYPEIVGVDRVNLIENMLMSTAEPIKNSSTGVYYSPRVQGAGGVKAANAVMTPVILTGSTGKGKINLGHRLGQTFDVKFTAKNIASADAVYDKVSLAVMTDGHTVSNGKYLVSNSVNFSVDSHTLPLSLSLAAGESKEISAKITLNQENIDLVSAVFTNGFYIDGFIRFENSEGKVPPIGIPFMGFYGDWTKASVFDNTIYDAEARKSASDTYLYTTISGSAKTLGSNGNGGYDSKYIALSPNGDGYHDTIGFAFSPMRTMSKISYKVTDANGNAKTSKLTQTALLNKFSTYNLSSLNNISSLADGDYKMCFDATYNYSTTNPTNHVLEIPFYVDTKVPEILNAKVTGDTLQVKFKDNKHLAYMYTYYEDENGTVKYDKKTVANPTEGSTVTVDFDLSDIGASDADYKDIYIFVHDNAENHYANSLSCLMGDIHPVISSFTSSGGVYSVSFDFVSYKPTQNCNMILAFYASDGTLIHANAKNSVSLANGSSQTFASVTDVANAEYCRLFILKNDNTINPVEYSKSFDISE